MVLEPQLNSNKEEKKQYAMLGCPGTDFQETNAYQTPKKENEKNTYRDELFELFV